MVKNEAVNGIAFVIFGITGDLTRRKLIPALYQILQAQKLPEPFHIIGFARRDWSGDFMAETLIQGLRDHLPPKTFNAKTVGKLFENSHYIQSEFGTPDGYKSLAEYLRQLQVSVVFYLATPPNLYVEIIQNIKKSDAKNHIKGWNRIVVEKPVGDDLESAQVLESEIHGAFKEKEIFRIDHYLGKETVQNILVLRFANGIFEPLWDRRYVDQVQITVAETNGIGTRADYYERAGVIRDMFQNHLLQLLTLTAMEAPVSFSADPVRDEKVKVLRALRPFKGADAIRNTIRAQYSAGEIAGEKMIGYKEVQGVSKDSITETFLAAKLFVDNWRWAGVPFYIRSGKGLAKRATQIAIHFKMAPLSLFDWKNLAGDAPNILTLNLQPNEGITLTFGAKSPGPMNQVAPVKMDFSYLETFGAEPPEAYVRLLQDCLMGDATLFTRSDEVLAQWTFTENILKAWNEEKITTLPQYPAGSWGPTEVDDFITSNGHKWHNVMD